jgi:hypothetical protein
MTSAHFLNHRMFAWEPVKRKAGQQLIQVPMICIAGQAASVMDAKFLATLCHELTFKKPAVALAVTMLTPMIP